jgi:transketolase
MKKLTKIKDLQLMANQVRQDIVSMLFHAGSGHPAGSLGLADVMVALYFNILKHDPKKTRWKDRDRLILSNGHVCPVRYSVMAQARYFPVKELYSLRKLGSRLQGHPSRLDLPGLEMSTASLGQGLGASVGMALAAKLKKEKHTIYCITSDGESDEGSIWESVNAANKYKLDNLINIVDVNNIQISGYTQDVWPLESFKKKYEAFHWKVYEINGHDFKQIIETVKKAKKEKGPVCILAYTIPGKGISFMEHSYKWHGKTPSLEEMKKALAELNKGKENILKRKK